jgi:hypothetical protein
MRERASDEGDILHAGEAEVGDELAAAAQQAVVLLAQETRANALLCHQQPTPVRPKHNAAALRP